MISSVVDSERCYYRTLINIPVVKCTETLEKEFLISIYCKPRRTYVEITIMPEKIECESYRIYITHKDYKELIKAQDLLIDFRDFPKELRTLLSQYENDKLKVQIIFDQDNTIGLDFSIIHNVKKLTILKVPLRIYKRAMYLQTIHATLRERFQIYFNRYKMLQELVKEHNRRHQEMKAKLVLTHDKKEKLEPQTKYKFVKLNKEKLD